MPDGSNIVPDDIAGLKKDLADVSTQVREFATSINEKMTAGAAVSAELKESADKVLTEQGALRARIDEVEQKLARRGSDPDQAQQHQTPGQRFAADERVKKFISERESRGRVRVPMAAITTQGVGATRDVLVPADRQAGIVTPPLTRLTIRNLLTPGRTSQNAVQYVRELGFANAAAVVSEGALKPESDIDYELKIAVVATIAHFMRASKQILDDAPQLESQIDGRLRYGLQLAEEIQLLNGDGTGNNLHGLIPLATAFSRSFSPELPTRIDDIRLAILQSELALFPSTGIVLNPIDWGRIELTKDADGRYIFATPQTLAGPTLWSRPIVSTTAISATRFLTGAFALGAQIFDREDANVELSTEDQDNFVRNLVTLRGEERLALCVYRPESFIYGQFMVGT